MQRVGRPACGLWRRRQTPIPSGLAPLSDGPVSNPWRESKPSSTASPSKDWSEEERGIFRVLDIGKPNTRKFTERRRVVKEPTKHREKEMSVNQDWGSVWPGTRTFHPSVVPLPVRQGFVQHRSGVTPSKYANIELMKTPNFLHLTPPVVKKQTALLKTLCTPWPSGNCMATFPVLTTTSTYLNASSSIRDERARKVELEVSVDALSSEPRIRENIRILMDMVETQGATLKLSTSSCPTRKQNMDHVEFLLTAIYFESRKNDVLDRSERKPLEGVDMSQAWPAHEVLTQGESRSSLLEYKSQVLKRSLS